MATARLSGRAVNAGEYRVTCRDGSVRICELHAAFFVADGLIVTFDDITERKRAGREHDRMAAALEQSPDSIFIVDTDFRIVHANPTYVASVGHVDGRGGRVGARPTSRTASSTQPCPWPDGEPVLLWSGRPWSGEVDHRNPDGTLSRMEASITPLREATGEISGWLGVARDVTDRNRVSRTTSRSQ